MDDIGSKSEGVQRLVSGLRERLGDALVLVDHWREEPDAVGIAHHEYRGRLAYVCCYPGGYFVSLESPPGSEGDGPYRAAGDHNDLELDAALEVIERHLGDRDRLA